MASLVKGGSSKDGDGRSTRWDEHREARRAELVAAAVSAIDTHGPNASIAEVAASAGVSKPVLYRYFADKDDLYRAVGQWGAQQVIDRLVPILTGAVEVGDGSMRGRMLAGCEDYLEFLDEHPQVFLLLVEHRSANDPLADGKDQIASTLAKLMGDTLRRLGVDAAGAEPWAHGLIGMGLAVGEWRIRRDIMSREATAGYLATFVWHAFSGYAAEVGVAMGTTGELRVLPDATEPRSRRKDAR
ncbi:TetR/AcrR family transcriptional regulator [Nocardioides marmoriginsengisoli]|uniref:TetR/AcrR family transcriptional regulator n=1 Tax=Nocardioides marmoriginsengisoli TaxID=661483 RepID=A0A3N0CJK7_9ACTN|nr:TetR/AcrR family transcriptional regulator [Nocardioides marmoriginsengisoli]RNL63123.1 TetR/AcrR family transcriptional regulator [Nocardioides marmoriginsengisoli]